MEKVFTRTVLNDVILIDNIITLHYFEYVKKFFGIGESHDFWEMVYVDCGSINAVAGEEIHTLNQGEAIFHRPNEYHNIMSNGDFASAFIITFESRSADVDFFQKRRVVLNNEEKGWISQILTEGRLAFAGALDIMDQTKLIRRWDAAYGSEQMVKMLLQALLITIIRNNRGPLETREQRQLTAMNHESQIVKDVVQLLSGRLYETLTLEEICGNISFSKSYVEKIFKKHIGYGIMKYHNLLKVEEAKRLISEEKYSFTQIAELLHFGSIHYFSRIFKATTYMSPSDYAKSVKARALL